LELAQDLIDTMQASPACVGLAANQIGDARRAFVVDVSTAKKAGANHGLIVVFDPVILDAGPAEIRREGCMSVPDLTGDVARPTSLILGGLAMDGTALKVEAEGFEARAICHEIDHLDGKVFLDRLVSRDRLFARKVYR
jgi:peptide deformylase